MIAEPQKQNTKLDSILKKQQIYNKKEMQILNSTLQFSGLKLPSQIDYRAIKIYQIDHIHEIYSNNQNTCLPHILFLHGFGGTSMTFVRFFRNLKDYYRVHAIDALGCGHSSRGVFQENFNYQQARKYFIDAIQQWRVSLGIDKFILVGHSFGGYLAACYAEDYPDIVTRLILLSPAGTTQKTPQQVQEELKNRYKNDGIRGKLFNFFAETVYNLKIKPSSAMGYFIIGGKLIDRIVDIRMKLKNEESEAWKNYFKDLSKRESASQTGFYIIFEWPLKPKHTIQNMLTALDFKKPIEFYYGQYDWMDSKGAERLKQKYENVKYDIISEADHQLIFDNPDEVCYYILLRRTPEQLALYAQCEKQKNEIKQVVQEERTSEHLPMNLLSL